MQKPRIQRSTKKTAYMEIGVWLGNDGHIRIARKGGGFISTVSADPESKRYHPHLYKKLKEVLQNLGMWGK